jgi:hypothetical protein
MPARTGVELDIARAGEQIALAVGKARAEAPRPERAAAAIAAVDVVRMGLRQMLHQQRAALRGRRRVQQMHVVRHQAIGVHRAVEALGEAPQMLQIEGVVRRFEEAGRAIVAFSPALLRSRSLPTRCLTAHTRP